jgi:hypothetical protein
MTNLNITYFPHIKILGFVTRIMLYPTLKTKLPFIMHNNRGNTPQFVKTYVYDFKIIYVT